MEILFAVQKFYERHRRLIRAALLSGAIVGVVILVALGRRSSVRHSAGELIARGISRYNAGEMVAARDDFEALVHDYPGTRPGRDAYFYLGKIYLDSDDDRAAKESFFEYVKKGENVFLKAAALESLGNMARSDGEYEEAATLFLRAASLSTFPFNQQQNKIYAAECWLKAGNREKARTVLNELESAEDVHRVIRDQIEELSAYFDVVASRPT